jgi:5,10-methylene-tetrahydrofolate dehydrogenase/methenyl tetrahydrofolate cyclohydrolase
VAGDARQSGGTAPSKRRGRDAGNYPEDNDHNNNVKSSLEEAEESGPIYPCNALAVFKILELFRSSLSSGGGVLPLLTPAVVSTVNGGRHGQHHEDATMTIINKSEVLGLSLAVMLSRMAGATVYSVDVDSVL